VNRLDPTEIRLIIVCATFAVGYVAYYALSHDDRANAWFARRYDHDRAELVRVLLHRSVIVLGFGVVPGVLLVTVGGASPADYGVVAAWHPTRAAVVAGLSLVVVAVIRLNPGRRKLTALYPQMRIAEWRPGHIAANAAGWAAYLFAYELMFRGFLLRAMLPYGVPAAVALNILLYVVVHVPKGLTEAIAAIPFGLLVCYLTLEFGTIWPAFVLHLALALANSFVAIHENPEMRLAWFAAPPSATGPSGRSAAPSAGGPRAGATARDD
jgi:hypothetical protein